MRIKLLDLAAPFANMAQLLEIFPMLAKAPATVRRTSFLE